MAIGSYSLSYPTVSHKVVIILDNRTCERKYNETRFRSLKRLQTMWSGISEFPANDSGKPARRLGCRYMNDGLNNSISSSLTASSFTWLYGVNPDASSHDLIITGEATK